MAILAVTMLSGASSMAQDLTPPPGWPGTGDSAGAAAGFSGAIPCAVRPSRTVRVAAPVEGIVARVLVRPGQKVAEGDVLAEFDTDLTRSELALAEARAADTSAVDTARVRIAALSQKVDRLEHALSRKAVPEADVEAARLERDTAKGELARAEAQLTLNRLDAERVRIRLDKAVVRAPVAGIVGEGLIGPGEAPNAQQPIATITVTDPLRVEAYVPAPAVPDFLARGGHLARIAGQERALTFDYTSGVADVSSNTISIYFTLSAPDLLPGLDCVIVDRS